MGVDARRFLKSWIDAIDSSLNRVKSQAKGIAFSSIHHKGRGQRYEICFDKSAASQARKAVASGKLFRLRDEEHVTGFFTLTPGRDRKARYTFTLQSGNRSFFVGESWKTGAVLEAFSQQETKAILDILEEGKKSPSLPARRLLALLQECGSTLSWKERTETLAIRYRTPVHFIWGPPGTGKTRCIADIIASSKGKTMLVTAYANKAVDRAYETVSRRTEGSGINLARRKGKVRKDEEWLQEGTVVFATISSVLSNADRIKEVRPDIVLVDEAGTTLTPYILALAMLARERIVIAGDHRQLSAVKDDFMDSESTSAWETIYRSLRIDEDENPVAEGLLEMLRTQSRMDHEIASFISSTFYGGQLDSSEQIREEKMEGNMASLFSNGMSGIDISFIGTRHETRDGSHMNLFSAYLSASIAIRLCSDNRQCTVGIASTYRAQSELMDAILDDSCTAQIRMRIKSSTVHSFQGSEQDIIIFDTVDTLTSDDEQTLGALYRDTQLAGNDTGETDRLINVAVSRAKSKFILVTDYSFFSLMCTEGDSIDSLLDSCFHNEDRASRYSTFRNVLHELSLISSPGPITFGMPGKAVNIKRKESMAKSAWSMRREARKLLEEPQERQEATFYIAHTETKTASRKQLFSKRILENAESGKLALKVEYGEGSFKITESFRNSHKEVDFIQHQGFSYPFSCARFSTQSVLFGLFYNREDDLGESHYAIRTTSFHHTMRFLYSCQLWCTGQILSKACPIVMIVKTDSAVLSLGLSSDGSAEVVGLWDRNATLDQCVQDLKARGMMEETLILTPDSKFEGPCQEAFSCFMKRLDTEELNDRLGRCGKSAGFDSMLTSISYYLKGRRLKKAVQSLISLLCPDQGTDS